MHKENQMSNSKFVQRQFTQYEVNGNSYSPVGVTEGRMAAGYYDIGSSFGRFFFTRKSFDTDNLLRMPDTKSDEVISEIQRFWGLRDRFAKYGLMHKRGVLMHGPPGSGKTGTIMLVMEWMIENDGIIINGNTHPGILIQGLKLLREVESDRNIIVVFEDIDNLLNSYGDGLLLQLLDGESSVPSVMFIATTNYLKELPPRIRNRPSRFDRVLEIGMPSPAARRLYLDSRKLDVTSEILDEWVVKTDGFSIAQLKDVVVSVMIFDLSVDDAVKRLKEMGNEATETQGTDVEEPEEPEEIEE